MTPFGAGGESTGAPRPARETPHAAQPRIDPPGTARLKPDKTAVSQDDRRLSYGELDRAARGVAASLRARGVEPGDRVALLVPNVPEFTIAYFGILYAGCTVVPINVLAAAPEVAYFLEDSDARLLIVHPLFEAAGRAGRRAAGVPVVVAGGDGSRLAAGDGRRPIRSPRLHPTLPTDTAVILYTSGTTGKPKGAELTHSNLLMNCAMVVPKLMPEAGPDARGAGRRFRSSTRSGRRACRTPPSRWAAPSRCWRASTPAKAFEVIERDRVTFFAGVPTMYFALLHHEADAPTTSRACGTACHRRRAHARRGDERLRGAASA